MNILIDILHPAHVHFFKGYIKKAKEEGHSVFITTRNKEITNALLDRLNLPYQHISTPGSGWLEMFRELILRWWKIYRLINIHEIQVTMSISGLSTALPARLRGIPNINFTDTEDAGLSNKISFPFSDIIATPEFFLHDLGKKHYRYRGLHELAYLKHFDINGLSQGVRSLGLPDRYVVIRLVANDAVHDIGIKGVPFSKLEELMELVGKFGRVYLNSQAGLPHHLQKYQLTVPIEDVHTVLAGAQLFVGDSPTMAVESSLLGAPAFLLSSRWKDLGNMVCLERDYNLLRNFSHYHELETAIKGIEDLEVIKAKWKERAVQFRQDADDIREMIEQQVEIALQKKVRNLCRQDCS